MFEHRSSPLLPRRDFLRRLAVHGGYAIGLLVISLGIGVMGFHYLAEQSPIDSLLNAAMLLGGMGPVGNIVSDAGKLFASAYALYAGLVFIGISTILAAPVMHRLMHTFHLRDSK